MSHKGTQIAVGTAFVAALAIPIALAQTEASGQDSRPLTIARSGTSISADDHYLYILGNGQIQRIDKATGMAAGQLTTTGWTGEAPAPGKGAAGATGNATTGTPTTGTATGGPP